MKYQQFEPNFNQNNQPVEPPKKGSIRFSLIFAIVIILIISTAIGIYWWQKSKISTPTTGNNSIKKIVGPPKGMYLGQNNRAPDDIDQVESAIGRKIVLGWYKNAMKCIEGCQAQNISFDVAEAQKAWDNGNVIMVTAYEAYPGGGHQPFTVDKLLNGNYDQDLKKLAQQFRQFGKPMFFTTAREPNAVLADYMGGFGVDGEQSLMWAVENNKGLAEFNPSKFPNAQLYKGLGDPNVCDGLERLIAAQRYYYDFFVNKEKLTFLSFDSMGWAVPFFNEQDLITDLGPSVVGTYRYELTKKCQDFETFYKGIDGYVDWVSINWYLAANSKDKYNLEGFRKSIETIRKVALGKPILITELGFCKTELSGFTSNPEEKVKVGMNELLKTPEIKGFVLWGSTLGAEDWSSPVGGCTVKPNTPEGNALKEIVQKNQDKFHSCAYLSDGSRMPNCSDTPKPVNLPSNSCTTPGGESGIKCATKEQCSTKEWVNGCCIGGTCS